MNSSFAITGGSNQWLRSKPCSVSGPGTNPQPIRRCGAGGDLQSAKLNLTPTYWGLLKQPDKHEPTSFHIAKPVPGLVASVRFAPYEAFFGVLAPNQA